MSIIDNNTDHHHHDGEYQDDNHHHDHLEPKSAMTTMMLMRDNSKRATATTPRDAAWERRRRQMLRRSGEGEAVELTDEDLSELKGCIELGFGFNEEDGQGLCETLPALDLYFAVNRQLSPSPASTPRSRPSTSSLSSSSSLGRSSPTSPRENAVVPESTSWKICTPGEDPQQVKTKIRHWAQAVACSVMQSL